MGEFRWDLVLPILEFLGLKPSTSWDLTEPFPVFPPNLPGRFSGFHDRRVVTPFLLPEVTFHKFWVIVITPGSTLGL